MREVTIPPLARGGAVRGARQEPPLKRDPAPSRLSYRMDRLWLTPFFRMLVRRGLPLAFVAGMVGAWVGQEDNRAMVAEAVAEMRAEIEGRPEFQVKLMAIDGAEGTLADQIRAVLPVDFPVSSFDLDLEEMRRTVVALDPVKEASLRVRPGGILQVDIARRVPVAVWRSRDGLALLDGESAFVGPLESRMERPDLPLLAGQGAADHLPEALALFAAARPIAGRVRGLVRMGERRWDLVLDRGQRVMLPSDGALAALERVIALHEAQDVLERDVIAVDLRNPRRLTIRMSPAAAETLRETRAVERIAER
ncbi:cell division protein FtsQ/DivIB [Aestuariibius sp. 2305UL40-4]|uniref:cell division protein FtsQ/DivIB n=1 Tax=Aestuariibius violaceus TaxID=3234132 RepID=UPI00345E3A83